MLNLHDLFARWRLSEKLKNKGDYKNRLLKNLEWYVLISLQAFFSHGSKHRCVTSVFVIG